MTTEGAGGALVERDGSARVGLHVAGNGWQCEPAIMCRAIRKSEYRFPMDTYSSANFIIFITSFHTGRELGIPLAPQLLHPAAPDAREGAR